MIWSLNDQIKYKLDGLNKVTDLLNSVLQIPKLIYDLPKMSRFNIIKNIDIYARDKNLILQVRNSKLLLKPRKTKATLLIGKINIRVKVN